MYGHEAAVPTRPTETGLPEGYGDCPVWEPVPDRLPVWIAATILVGLSGVFWVGLLTIAQWSWHLIQVVSGSSVPASF